ncbi:MAG: pehV [Candidatus Brocadiaceae bacterium]|nr:pehV [Candidatus Brocadiaceae bacterium]
MNSKRQSDKLGIVTTWAAESGIVFIAVLVLIVILALVGTIAVITTNTDIKISGNYKANVKALYAAQAGSEEARARLRGPSSTANYAGDPDTDFDEDWSAYILTSITPITKIIFPNIALSIIQIPV